MAVPLINPSLPSAGGIYQVGELVRFDGDLARALQDYLILMARAVNSKLPLDGSLPMTGGLTLGGNLNMGGFAFTNLGPLLSNLDLGGFNLTNTGSWEHIRTDNPASVASVNYTGLSAFRILRSKGWLRPATDIVGLMFRTSTNNGSSYDAGASDYNTAYLFQSGAVAGASDATLGTSFNPNISGIGNVAPEAVWFDLTLYEFNQAQHCGFLCQLFQLTGTTTTLTGVMSGRRLSTTARNAFQVLHTSGNIAAGNLQLQGIRG